MKDNKYLPGLTVSEAVGQRRHGSRSMRVAAYSVDKDQEAVTEAGTKSLYGFQSPLLVTYYESQALPHEEHFKYFYEFRNQQPNCKPVGQFQIPVTILKIYVNCIQIASLSWICLHFILNTVNIINLRIYSGYFLFPRWTLICPEENE